MIRDKNRNYHQASPFLFVLCLVCTIFNGCAAPHQKPTSAASTDDIVYAEGRGSSQDSASHISRPDRPTFYLLPGPKQLKDFQLTDDHGQPFDLRRLLNHWTFLYFGYTNCPDVCPMTTSLLNRVYTDLSRYPKIKNNTQVAFISVDPVRDTPQTLHTYITYFNENFAAAVGPESRLDELTEQMDAKHQILYSEHFLTHEKKIRVLHDSAIYLVDPSARLYAIFSPPFTAKMVKHWYLSIREKSLKPR